MRQFVTTAFSTCMLGLSIAQPQAASFDCARASTSFEKAICADPELSRADEDMAKAFNAARQNVSQAARDDILRGQREWLYYAQRACNENAGPAPSAYDEDGIFCLQQIFGVRLEVLSENAVRFGYRFYTSDHYDVEPAKDSQEWSKKRLTEISTLKIDAEDDVAAQFNALTQVQAEQASQPFGEQGAGEDDDTDKYVNIWLGNSNQTRLSAQTNAYYYPHGAAHGMATFSYTHLLTETGKELKASDLMNGKGWRKALSDLVIKKLKSDLGTDMVWDDLTDVSETAANPSFWKITPESLGIQFQSYDVAPYAAGAPIAEIPWEEISSWLTPEADAIIGR